MRTWMPMSLEATFIGILRALLPLTLLSFAKLCFAAKVQNFSVYLTDVFSARSVVATGLINNSLELPAVGSRERTLDNLDSK